ncbi:hypothetical protein [Lentibacillus sp.]|uniref:hypothetical protein n=1 Tax=Lentibacillus sp. TaxID=1925746 RepID=UPI002B4AC1E5|nr:hypothetical protein [Lentibacillus sp.]HLS08876.1 hypothetical protein [Lentibacillus sp.]
MEFENEKRQKREKKKSVYTNQVRQLKQSNAALQRKLENYDLLTYQKYGNLEQEIKAL